jgi:hypothetical protein
MFMAALAIPALLLGAVACSDDDDSAEGDSNASAQNVDDINARIQRNEMAVALLGIGALPLHDIDETIASGDEIPGNAIPSMRTIIRLVTITEWDTELQADADAIKASAEAFITAAESDDHGAVAEHATAIHDGWHDFSEMAWDVVAPGTGGEHSDGDDTPSSDETPHDDGDEEEHSDETPEATP